MKQLVVFVRKLFTPQFVRFVLVAMLNTAFGWCVYALLLLFFNHLKMPKPFIPASLIGTIISIFFNFKTYGHIVFRNKSNRLIFKFVMVYSFTYLCNIGGIALLERWGISNYPAGAITAIPVGFLGYFLNKFFVYRKKIKDVIQDWGEQKDTFNPYEILGKEPDSDIKDAEQPPHEDTAGRK